MKDGAFLANVTVPSRVESVRPAACFLVNMAQALNVPTSHDRLFEVAIVEALNNSVKHGTTDPDDSVVCELELVGRSLTIRILGRVAIPSGVVLPEAVAPWPDLSADDWESIPENGYGLHLIAAVFPQLRPITRGDRHGLELELSF